MGKVKIERLCLEELMEMGVEQCFFSLTVVSNFSVRLFC